MDDVKYLVNAEEKKLYLTLPVKNKGKFRWKTREDNTGFGIGFATTITPFSNNSYIEWQIGYDVKANDREKTTELDNLDFISLKGERKHPYELSEILNLMVESGIIDRNDISELYNEIENQNFLLDNEDEIRTEAKEPKEAEGFTLNQQNIILPTYSYSENPNGCSIEISIQKQQNAFGVQPMLYVTIPISCFNNGNEILDKTSQEAPDAVFEINESNRDFILNTFKLFGICSERHRHDIEEILNLLARDINNS